MRLMDMDDTENHEIASWKEILVRQAKQDALAGRPPMIRPAGASFECAGVDVVVNGALNPGDCKAYVDTYVIYRLFGDLRPLVLLHGTVGGPCIGSGEEPTAIRVVGKAKQGKCVLCGTWNDLRMK